MITLEEMNQLGKMEEFMKDLVGIGEIIGESDGVHDSGRVRFVYGESEGPKKWYWLDVSSWSVEVVVLAINDREHAPLPEKLKSYISDKLPGAKFSQPCLNVYQWKHPDLEKILGI